MKWNAAGGDRPGRVARPWLAAALVLLAALGAPGGALAQRRFQREYPAQPNVRLHLHNRSGTIEVVAWNKNRIRISATMESPAWQRLRSASVCAACPLAVATAATPPSSSAMRRSKTSEVGFISRV